MNAIDCSDHHEMDSRSVVNTSNHALTDNSVRTLAILYSTGDLGDVGRHAVAAALEYPSWRIPRIRVFSSNVESLSEKRWKCACKEHEFSREDLERLEFVPLDCTIEPIGPYLSEVDAFISCLGNRKLFHPDCIAKVGTEHALHAIVSERISRFVSLSSVGIADDWPPMEWCQEGLRLQGFFRTVCWEQYQDLSGAELSIHQIAQQHSDFDFLIARAVMLEEHTVPSGEWYIQKTKHKDHPEAEMAKMDCARFLVKEAVSPSLHRRVVTVGGVPRRQPATR